MPFTLSHAAAAVPLARLRLPLSALVVGSMSPDFLYFVTQSTYAKFGHTWAGVVLFCVPVGLAVLWVYHTVIKRPLIALLPDSLSARMVPLIRPFPFGPSRRLGVIVVALGLGAVTHVVWDAFTSPAAFGVALFPVLRDTALHVFGDPIPWYTVIQHVSTLVGALLLLFWSAHWLRKRPVHPVQPSFSAAVRWSIIGVLLVLTVVPAWLWGLRAGDPFGAHWEVRDFVQRAVIGGIPLLFGLLVVLGFLTRLGGPPMEPPPQPAPPTR